MSDKNKLECVGGMLDGEFRKDIGERFYVPLFGMTIYSEGGEELIRNPILASHLAVAAYIRKEYNEGGAIWLYEPLYDSLKRLERVYYREVEKQ